MKNCVFCSSKCNPILIDRLDYEFGNNIQLEYWKCSNSKCGLVFVDPLPSIESIQSFYTDYSTHIDNYSNKIVNPVSLIGTATKKRFYQSMFVNCDLNSIKILDFGCGNANLLMDLRKIGLSKLFGYDFDTKATDFSETKGFMIFSDYDEIKKNAPYDFIFLNHVVEHLVDARGEIQFLVNCLTPSGKVFIRTPNSNSFLQYLFRDYWRGWETPRHLRIYNYNCIDYIAGNCEVLSKYSSNMMFTGAYHESINNYPIKNTYLLKLLRHLFLPLVYLLAQIFNFCFSDCGDEVCIVLISSKKE
jgi:2-polyprenyl-3-methyl-5-hydroxy-6-metoxy-1,4-benzoquinol methylase